MDHAIVVAGGRGLDEENLGSFGDVVFGSLPQLKRLILTAQRAGIKRFTVLTEENNSSLKETVAGDHRIESDISWHSIGSPIEFLTDPCLLLQSNLVTTPDTLSDFMDTTEVDEDEVMLLLDDSQDAWIKTEGDGVKDLFSQGGKAVGAFITSGKLLEKSISDSMCLKTWTKELIGRESVKFKSFDGDYWIRLSSDEGSAQEAEDLLFSYVGKTATGWISRNINSQISLPLSRLFIRTPVTPNMLSIFINIIGALNGVFYAMGFPVLGALFMEIATVLDRCDGEVARVKMMETKIGQWVDTIADQFTVLSFIIGVPVGYYLITENPIAIILGAVNLGIFIFFLVWSFYFLVKYTDSGSLVAYFKVDDYVGEENMSFMRKVIAFVRPMARRNFYAFGFLVLAIVGGYPWVLGATSGALVLFLLHQVEDIIKLRRQKSSV